MSDTLRPAPPMIHYGRALGFRCERWEELRREIHAVHVSPELTEAQKAAIGNQRIDEFEALSKQIVRLGAVNLAHLAGMTDHEAIAFLSKVAAGAITPAPLPTRPQTGGAD
jgi:hypothetical protein